MKLQNLLSTIVAVVMLMFGPVSLADESTAMNSDAVTVNVNQADAATIANALSGVGLSRARAIVEYRDQYGPFYSAEELTAVKGIGQSTVDRNLSRITTE